MNERRRQGSITLYLLESFPLERPRTFMILMAKRLTAFALVVQVPLAQALNNGVGKLPCELYRWIPPLIRMGCSNSSPLWKLWDTTVSVFAPPEVRDH